MSAKVQTRSKSLATEWQKHPCFNREARHTYSRIHLPVAARCNMQCNYCNRDYSCVNESRPGVTCALLDPRQALEYLRRYWEKAPNLSVVGIAGPGDPFANPEETMETLSLVKEEFPELLLCVATNGLALLPLVKDLAQLQVSHVTVTVNAIEPQVGAKLYRWMQVGDQRLEGARAAEILWHNQAESIFALAKLGVTVKVNTVYVPGINDDQILKIADTVASLGAEIHNVMPLLPVAGTPFEVVPEPDKATMRSLRAQAGAYLPQMSHCSRCRADAAGLIGETCTRTESNLVTIGK